MWSGDADAAGATGVPLPVQRRFCAVLWGEWRVWAAGLSAQYYYLRLPVFACSRTTIFRILIQFNRLELNLRRHTLRHGKHQRILLLAPDTGTTGEIRQPSSASDAIDRLVAMPHHHGIHSRKKRLWKW